MTSIIKNQIIKHLSKFVKNLSSDKIGLSTLKGEGQLTNLELDEQVLMDVLELPSWIVISKVTCNRLSIKIPWTKLKTHPICLYLDQVELEMETCRDLRKTENKQALQLATSKYGFPERVVDGMYVHVNSIIGKFKSDTFHADIQIAQLIVQSTTPDWKPADLRYSRIKDMNRGQVLTFKAVEWSTFRLTVDAIEKGSGSPTTPIRLITNQGKICITIKKRLNDCSLVTSRLQVLLDDILWVLTDSQIKASMLHMRSLNPVIQKAAAQSKVHAEAAGEAVSTPHPTEDPANRPQNVKTSKELQLLQFFERYDVPETSYHFFTKRVDLHLCDEMNRPETDKNSAKESFKRRIEGGAMQISFTGVSFDYYPYHIASSPRTHWQYFDDAMSLSDKWIHTVLAHFKQQYAMARNELKKRTAPPTHPATPPPHPPHTKTTPPARPATPPTRTQSQTGRERTSSASHGRPPGRPGGTAAPPHGQPRSGAMPCQGNRTSVKLMSSCLVFRIRALQLSNVATSDRGANNEENLRNNLFLMSDKNTFHLPPEIPSIHVEYMSFYFPNELDFPVPAPVIYAQINPMQLRLDNTTLLWLNQFAFNVMQTLPEIDEIAPASQTSSGQDHIDIRVDALMQKVLIPVPDPVANQPDRPKILQVQVSQVTATNCRVGTNSSRPDLSKVLQKFQGVQLFHTTTFPSNKTDLQTLPAKFWKHAYEPNFLLPPGMQEDEKKDSIHKNGTPPQMREVSEHSKPLQDVKMKTYTFRPNASDDVWGIKVDQVWADFVGVPSSPDRPVPFIQPLPLGLWMCSANSNTSLESRDQVSGSSPSLANMHLVVDTPSFVDITINHYQLLFLLRLQQSLQLLSSNMELDQNLFAKDEPQEAMPSIASRVISVVFPSIHVTLLGPPSSVTDKQEDETTSVSDLTNVKDDGKVEDSSQDAEADSGGNVEESSVIQKTELSDLDQSSSEVVTDSSSPTSDSVDLEHDVKNGICISVVNGDGVHGLDRSDIKALKLDGPPGAVVITGATPNGNGHTHTSLFNNNEPVAIGKTAHPVSQGQAPRKNNSASDLTQSGSVSSETSGGSLSNLSGNLPKSSSQNSITVQMNALMSASSMASLDEQGMDFETISVSSDSSEGFTMVTQGSRLGSTADIESESGLGSEFSQSLSTIDGPQDSVLTSSPNLLPGSTSTVDSSADSVPSPDAKPKVDDFEGCIHKLRQISVLTFDLHGVAAVLQMCNKNVVLRAAVLDINKEEKGNTDFTKYMNVLDSDHATLKACVTRACIEEKLMLYTCTRDDVRFLFNLPASTDNGDYHRESIRQRKGKEDGEKVEVKPSKALLRFTSGPLAETLCEQAGERGYMQLQLNDVDLNFVKSSLTNLSSLVQDEMDSLPMPLDITVFNTAVTLQDDAPLVYPDTVASPPLQLRIPSVRVHRSPDGAFHVKGIHPQGISLKSTEHTDPPSTAHPSDHTHTTTPPQDAAANETLSDENVNLRSRMALMKDALAVLERERTSLLSTLEHLQEELLTADRERDKLKEHVVELSRRVNLGR
ncbi:UHRF1-binding protein 1-like isoform X1 [Strongylocentrotus purpuratus]|uniref:UHRF1-binding protein 1-like n=1 Tax=Strongylocentrotus purpuratus TaxID=7668 RepID=A0A7M7ST59_STRPU|nr:UHRF1-binding protein 1-like isoform X1 [Strongylocentrotus purpuratus]